MLLVDMSGSGLFGTGEALKREKAAETAAILAFNAIAQQRQGGGPFVHGPPWKFTFPPKKGRPMCGG